MMVDVKKDEKLDLYQMVDWLAEQNENQLAIATTIKSLLIEKGIFSQDEFSGRLKIMKKFIDKELGMK